MFLKPRFQKRYRVIYHSEAGFIRRKLKRKYRHKENSVRSAEGVKDGGLGARKLMKKRERNL